MVKSKLVLYYPYDSYIFIHRLPDGIGARITTPHYIPPGSDENSHLLSASNDYHGLTSTCPLSIALETDDSLESGKHTLHLVGDYTTFPLDIVVEAGSMLDISVNTLAMDKTELTEEVKQNKLTITNHSNKNHTIVISSPIEGVRNIIDIDSNFRLVIDTNEKKRVLRYGSFLFTWILEDEIVRQVELNDRNKSLQKFYKLSSIIKTMGFFDGKYELLKAIDGKICRMYFQDEGCNPPPNNIKSLDISSD